MSYWSVVAAVNIVFAILYDFLIVVCVVFTQVSMNKVPFPLPADPPFFQPHHLLHSTLPGSAPSCSTPPPPLDSLPQQQPLDPTHRSSAQHLLHRCRFGCSIIPWGPGLSSFYTLWRRLLQLHHSVVGERLLDELKDLKYNRRFAWFVRPVVPVPGAPATLRRQFNPLRHRSFSCLWIRSR